MVKGGEGWGRSSGIAELADGLIVRVQEVQALHDHFGAKEEEEEEEPDDERQIWKEDFCERASSGAS